MTSRVGNLRMTVLAALVLAGAVAAPAAADWWYAVYEGDKHVGYCHVVESSATLGNTVVQRFTEVTETHRDKANLFTRKLTVDRYKSGGKTVYYSSTVTEKGKTKQAKATRTADGFSIVITKGDKEETVDVPAEEFGIVEASEMLENLTAPGGKTEVRAVDLDTGKVHKTKLEYVADQTVDAAGESVEAKVIAAKGGLGDTTYWFVEDGSLVKWSGKTLLGKLTYKLTTAAEAKPR
ncbi:MAG: hypothetical protein PVH29_04450 [Candidatus Zixiibacteriota bacterium]